MKQRMKLVAVSFLSVAIFAGCSTSYNEVNGTVENVGFGGTGNYPERYIKLEGSSDVYLCEVDNVQRCGAIEKGHMVSMQVSQNLGVKSLEYIEPE